jgi:hypothetical protein
VACKIANVRTEEIEELLLARMHPVLEHSSFCIVSRIRLLEQLENLGLVIACQPRAVVSFNVVTFEQHNAPVTGSANISSIAG